MSQRASHTPIELPLNQPKPSRKTRKNSHKNSVEEKKIEETLGGAIQWGIPSSRDSWWKRGAKHRLNIVIQQGSVRERKIDSLGIGKGPETRCCLSGRVVSTWRLDPAWADCHRWMSTGDQVQRWQTDDQADADSSNPPHQRGGVEERRAGIREFQEQSNSYSNIRMRSPPVKWALV